MPRVRGRKLQVLVRSAPIFEGRALEMWVWLSRSPYTERGASIELPGCPNLLWKVLKVVEHPTMWRVSMGQNCPAAKQHAADHRQRFPELNGRLKANQPGGGLDASTPGAPTL